MTLRMWYRGIRFAKDFTAQYLNYIYFANEKGALTFTDGRKEIKFSNRPIAMKRASWDFRVLPAVLIGKATGNLKYITFAKDILKSRNTLNDDGQTVDQFIQVGGDFDINISIAVRATTIEERDNLVDITSIYLAHPDAKDYFERHYLTLPEAPKLSGENDIHEPKIDHPIYETNLSLRILSRWQEEQEPSYDRLLNVIAEVSGYYELENPGREPLDES